MVCCPGHSRRFPDLNRIKALIADLEKKDFVTRARATAALKEHWPVSEAALRVVVAKPSSLEARRRAEGILWEMEKAVTPPGKLRRTAGSGGTGMDRDEGGPRPFCSNWRKASRRPTREAAAAGKRLERRK